MAFEDITDRLVTDSIAQVVQPTLNTVVSPRAILSGHTDHPIFDFFVDAGTTQRVSLRGAIELLGHQLAMPSQDSVRFGRLGDFLKCLLPQFLADLGQGDAFGIAEVETSLDLVAKDGVFCRQILITQENVLFHRTRDTGQQGLPMRWLRVLRRAERPQTLASRCGKINGLNSGSETWTEIGVVAGFLAGMGMIEWFYLKITKLPKKDHIIKHYNMLGEL